MNVRQSLYCLLLIIIAVCHGEEEDYNRTDNKNENTKVLSRRKRFLIFPDGSSFQFVFCAQNQGYVQPLNVFWFGNTAALAWELPSDPNILNIFKDKLKDPYIRRQDDKKIAFTDETGRVIARVPYKKRTKLIVNPAFAKRSVDFRTPTSIPVKEMHASNKETDFNEFNENSIEFHRKGRKSLYEKIESFFEALGWNGRQCVLRLLCESKKKKPKQGTFLEEIFRATFTLPKGREFEGYHKEYDVAHGSDGECGQLYPECEDTSGQQLFNNV